MHNTTIHQWQTWMTGFGITTGTIKNRVYLLNQFASTCDPVTASWEDIAGFMAANPHWSKGTRHGYFRILRSWFHWLVLMDYRPDDPTLKLPRPRSPRYLPRPVTASIGDVLAACRRRHTRTQILLAAYQGLRVSEVARVRGEDFHGDELRVLGKGGDVVWVSVHPLVQAERADYPATGWWFPSYTNPNRPINGATVSRNIGQTLHRAGAYTSTAHSLRHWFVTELVDAGHDLRTVQECSRHASLDRLANYARVKDSKRRAAIHSLPLPGGMS